MKNTLNSVGYLSGAPRASNLNDAENLAVKNHIDGVIQGMKKNGLEIKECIIGNYLPKMFRTKGSEKLTNKSKLNRLVADLVRLFIRYFSRIHASKKIENVDFVYEQMGVMQALGLPFKKKGIPWVLETHALLSDEAFYESKTVFLYSLSKYLEKRVYQDCDAIVSISEALKQAIVNKYDIPKHKIYVMPNGIDLEHFNPQLYQPRSNSKLVIGYIGALIKWQSLDLLFKAIKEIEDFEDLIRVEIVGDGPELENLQQLASNLEIRDVVNFNGQITTDLIPKYISQFDLGYCNPSHELKELDKAYNSPMKLYEYMAMSKPILSPLLPDLKNMKNYESYTYIIQQKGVLSITEAIQGALMNKQKLSQQGKLALQAIHDNHSWQDRVFGLKRHLGENL